MLKQSIVTTAPVAACEAKQNGAEWGRLRDVESLFGLRRGTVYNLLRDRKIRGCLLRVRGRTSGVRLIDLDSVREYIHSSMDDKSIDEEAG